VATIQEVSQRAKVSMATVSRVLNGNVPVSAATRARVLEAIAELNYHPNTFARGLVTNRLGGVGAVINDLASPFFGPMLSGIESVMEARGMHLMVSSGHARADSERDALEFLLHCHADALIVYIEALSNADMVAFAAKGTPVVLIGRQVPELEGQTVYLDNVAGGRLVTEHLLEHGHTRIAHITGSRAIYDSQARLEGYQQALAAASVPLDSTLVIEGDFQEQGGYDATKQLLAKTDFTALFASNDQMAAGALNALREVGLTVPDDVSLVGYDDVLLARYLYPPLTTVRQPITEMGRAAAQLALQLLDSALTGDALTGDALTGNHASIEEVTRRFEPTLIERQSVARRS